MREQRFTIVDRLPNLNELLVPNKHVMDKVKKCGMNQVMAAIRWDRVKPVKKYPASIEIQCYEPDKRRDPDNIMTAAIKIILDALQHADIIKGDGWRYIGDIALRYPKIDKTRPRIEVVIREDDIK